ncbi:hypothetical protein B0O80DRAFT_380109, partial [Mortierella sp. GBAus27b]
PAAEKKTGAGAAGKKANVKKDAVKEEKEEEEEVKKPVVTKSAEKKTPASKKAAPTAAAAQKPKATEKKQAPAAAEKRKAQEQEDNSDDDDDQPLMDDKALLKDIDSSADEDSSDDETEEDKAAMKEDTFASLKDEITLNPKAAAADKNTTGVVYLGRIPHGFYEEQMEAYFSQFGSVLRLRLSRNKKTGHSKHYAFIEFSSEEVADIVADTMNNYLLFGHLLKCKRLQSSQIHPALFQGANKKFKTIPWLKISKEKHNAEKSPEQVKNIKKNLLRNEAAKRAKLEKMGIDYDFPGYKASVQEKPKHIKF